MNVTYPESLRAYLDRIQSVSRFGRKPEPVTYVDIEVRDADDAIRMAYKVDDGPVHVLPWEAACARGDWSEADRLRADFFTAIRVEHQLRYYEDLAWLDKSWLTRKFLTLAAWSRKIFGQSTNM